MPARPPCHAIDAPPPLKALVWAVSILFAATWSASPTSAGDFPVCGEPGSGNCFDPFGTGSPGCELEECCNAVCDVAGFSFCCELEWNDSCAAQALEVCGISAACPGVGDCHEPQDTPSCGDEVCCVQVCEEMSLCCQLEWTQECADFALEECPCGAPNAGSCFEDHQTPGCEDVDCCNTVCGIDGFCCGPGWDSICMAEALQFCGVSLCSLECPAGALSEPEICGQSVNGGCNAFDPRDPDKPVFTPLDCGDVICGTTFADGTRDTDWYEITVRQPTQLTWTVTSEFPSSMFIVEGQCDTRFGALSEAFTFDCATASTQHCVDPGTYYLFVSTATDLRTLRRAAPCPECLHDLNGDLVVNAADLALLLGAWGANPDHPADFTEDGVVNAADLALLLGSWGPCEQPIDALWGNDYIASISCQPCAD